jgi:hypothetical protein
MLVLGGEVSDMVEFNAVRNAYAGGGPGQVVIYMVMLMLAGRGGNSSYIIFS